MIYIFPNNVSKYTQYIHFAPVLVVVLIPLFFSYSFTCEDVFSDLCLLCDCSQPILQIELYIREFSNFLFFSFIYFCSIFNFSILHRKYFSHIVVQWNLKKEISSFLSLFHIIKAISDVFYTLYIILFVVVVIIFILILFAAGCQNI